MGCLSAETAVPTWPPGARVRPADVACGTHADATRHARSRGRATRAHVRRMWRTGCGHVAGGHACPRVSMRTPVWGATWQGGRHMEGPRVSGP